MESEQLEQILYTVRRFVRDEIVPLESDIEDRDVIPDALMQKSAKMGLFGFVIPEEYGGLGLNVSEEVRLVFELGWTSPSFRAVLSTNNGIASHTLVAIGSEAQKNEFLPKLAEGKIMSTALTESEAGSDPSNLKTSAVRVGDEYVLNGSKRFITNAPLADYFLVFARTGASNSGASGISCFVVDADTKGLSVGSHDKKMGHWGSWTAEVFFQDVHVPAERLVGSEGSGYFTVLGSLARGRLHVAALCVGVSDRLISEMTQYAAERSQGGHAIGYYQLVQAMLADSQTEAYAGKSMVLDAASKFDSGLDRRMIPACCKYYCSEMVGKVADRAVQIFGGMGYIRGVPVERFYRDVRLFRIFDGTSQIQQTVIAKEMLRAQRGVNI